MAQWNRATETCERAWEIVKGDVNGGERVRIGENDMGKMEHYDEREREREVDQWHVKYSDCNLFVFE